MVKNSSHDFVHFRRLRWHAFSVTWKKAKEAWKCDPLLLEKEKNNNNNLVFQ